MTNEKRTKARNGKHWHESIEFGNISKRSRWKVAIDVFHPRYVQ